MLCPSFLFHWWWNFLHRVWRVQFVCCSFPILRGRVTFPNQPRPEEPLPTPDELLYYYRSSTFHFWKIRKNWFWIRGILICSLVPQSITLWHSTTLLACSTVLVKFNWYNLFGTYLQLEIAWHRMVDNTPHMNDGRTGAALTQGHEQTGNETKNSSQAKSKKNPTKQTTRTDK